MKNVTVTLKEDVARWARVKAAEQDKSPSKLGGPAGRAVRRNPIIGRAAGSWRATRFRGREKLPRVMDP
jgi:hypothetical protein